MYFAGLRGQHASWDCLCRTEVADFGAEHEVVLLGDDDAGALNVVVDESRVEAEAVVDVIEAVGEVGSDLHSGEPRRQDGVARVLRVAGLALEDDGIFGADGAAPGGGGEAVVGEEVRGRGADLREVVDLGVLREGGFKGFEGGDGGGGGGFGEVVARVVDSGAENGGADEEEEWRDGGI
ncbi:hypothetical protein ACFX15_006022 [Malus domestica]